MIYDFLKKSETYIKCHKRATIDLLQLIITCAKESSSIANLRACDGQLQKAHLVSHEYMMDVVTATEDNGDKMITNSPGSKCLEASGLGLGRVTIRNRNRFLILFIGNT